MGTDLKLDLPPSATPNGVGELAIAATLYAPDEVDEQDVGVLVCWPGGSYGRDYWDIHLPGRDGYSFAEHMTARGFVVIAADPLGWETAAVSRTAPCAHTTRLPTPRTER